jgi:hypothetical protein
VALIVWVQGKGERGALHGGAAWRNRGDKSITRGHKLRR